MNQWKFALLARVVVTVSGEAGYLIGRAECSTTPLKSYLIRVKGADGKGFETWWTEDALEEAPAESPQAVGPASC